MKRIIAVLVFIAAALALTGCSHGTYSVDTKATDYTNLNFVGTPSALLLGVTGTSTPISTSQSITAKHVSNIMPQMSVAKESGKCDVSVVSQSNSASDVHKLNVAKVGEHITIYGYSGITGLPVSSQGHITAYAPKSDCGYMLTTAGGVQGMSGGAVVNDQGEVVGILLGLDKYKKQVAILPVQNFVDVLPLDLRDQLVSNNPDIFPKFTSGS